MNEITQTRAVEIGEYIVKNQTTVRVAAKAFGISKSTVHMDVTDKLEKIDPILFRQVRSVLDENKSQRHIRGGLATREKYRIKSMR